MTDKLKTTRVQVEMPDASMQRLKRLQKETEAVSYAQVLKHALQLYEAVVDEQKAGSTMCIKRANGAEVELRLMMS